MTITCPPGDSVIKSIQSCWREGGIRLVSQTTVIVFNKTIDFTNNNLRKNFFTPGSSYVYSNYQLKPFFLK